MDDYTLGTELQLFCYILYLFPGSCLYNIVSLFLDMTCSLTTFFARWVQETLITKQQTINVTLMNITYFYDDCITEHQEPCAECLCRCLLFPNDFMGDVGTLLNVVRCAAQVNRG